MEEGGVGVKASFLWGVLTSSGKLSLEVLVLSLTNPLPGSVGTIAASFFFGSWPAGASAREVIWKYVFSFIL